MPHETQIAPVRRITQGPLHHFFGYYDKCPWDRTQRYVLAMQNSFMDRNPTMSDPLTVGYVDLKDGCSFHVVGQTRAWNWQQGCMLRWLPGKHTTELIYNDLSDQGYVSVVHDVVTGESRQLPYALYDIASNGDVAATLNFERITDTRPGYGYFGRSDPFGDELQPQNDGIYRVDLSNNNRELLFSIADAVRIGSVQPDPGHKAWFNHIKFNPSGTRMLFLHRWAKDPIPGHRGFQTRMMTIGADGSDPICLIEDCGVSHFDWYDDETIIVWLFDWNRDESQTGRYTHVRDLTGERSVVGEGLFQHDGHCNYSPNRQWLLTDNYPLGPERLQTLILYCPRTNHRVDIGAFAAMPVDNDSWRCDLHPRWNRDGTCICIDSTHEGSRQMYLVNVSKIQPCVMNL